MKKNKLDEILAGVKTAAIAAHVNPDGDAVGSCMGMYHYLKDNYPQIHADVYLEDPKKVFDFLEDMDLVRRKCDPQPYDLLILLDISSRDRIGVADALLETAEHIVCFDHHVTNRENFDWVFNCPDISSTCEVVYGFLDPDKIGKSCAEALYMGMAHDTGIFQYSSTTPTTMRIAASLMEKGIPFSKIIDDTYYQKSYVQNQIMGRTLMESIMMFDGKLIIGYVKNRDMNFYGVSASDMDGIVNQLRNTAGVEVAVFMYEREPGSFKVSLRSRERVDVSAIAQHYGGGGHVRAAGCTMQGSQYDVINNLTLYLEKELVEE